MGVLFVIITGNCQKGFHCNFGTASSILAELWGFIHGLHLAKSLHITSLAVELVSKVVVNMIQKRSSHSAHLWPLLAEAFSLMEATYWRYSIAHVFREANFSVDTLVDMRRHGGFQCTVLDFPPACISLALVGLFTRCCFSILFLSIRKRKDMVLKLIKNIIFFNLINYNMTPVNIKG